MSSKNFFWAKASVALFLSFENIAKEAIKARVIDVEITWVSNYRCPITKSSNRTAEIEHPRDRAPITWQIGAQRTNHDREFCYRYDYNNNNNNNNNNDNYGNDNDILSMGEPTSHCVVFL